MTHIFRKASCIRFIDERNTYNCKRSGIEQAILTTLDNLTLLTDADEVGGLDETKSRAEWIYPERIGFNRVAVRYMAFKFGQLPKKGREHIGVLAAPSQNSPATPSS